MVTVFAASGGEPAPARDEESHPLESHGRPLSTTAEAARHYRVAQGRHADRPALVAALSRAVETDPSFALAVADLHALEGREPEAHARPLRTWERHHVEVLAVARHDPERAADLLREHLASVACDPVVTTVVVGAVGKDVAADILRQLPGCHSVHEGRRDA